MLNKNILIAGFGRIGKKLIKDVWHLIQKYMYMTHMLMKKL